MSKVYLIFRTQMFQEAVSAILKTHPAIKLVGAAEEIALAMEEIIAQKPDVIFLEQAHNGAANRDLTALLNSPTPPRLVLLRLDADGMRIWSPTWHQSVHAQDLVDAVLAGGERIAPDESTPT
ncbi:MAG: hypothetical protein HY328_12100 [Chloroflexi bacterium]|nr:hypothetical protein [Chloroflexota bacterium]